MTLLVKSLSVALLTFFVISCGKDDPAPNPNVAFTATLNGASESSPNNSTATGSSTATFNTDTKILTISTTYSGVTATLGHIHKGAIGVAGPVIFPFTNLTSPINLTTPSLNATQEADLMANQYYVNIHSAAFPAGEIRGQLIR